MNVHIGITSSPTAIGEAWLGLDDMELRLGNWNLKDFVFYPRQVDDIAAVVNVLIEEAIHCAIDRNESVTASIRFDFVPLTIRNAICFNEWEGVQ